MRSHNRLFFAVAVKIHKEADIFHPKKFWIFYNL